MDILYIFALGSTLHQLLGSGYHTKLPWFFVSTISAFLFELAYQPLNAGWCAKWYPSLISAVMVFRCAAVAEAFWMSAKKSKLKYSLLIATASAASMLTLIVAWQLSFGTALGVSVQIRRGVLVWLSSFLGIYGLFLWSVGRWIGSHSFLLFTLCLMLSLSTILRTWFDWGAVNRLAYGACSVLFIAWTWLFFQLRSSAGRI